MSWTVFLNTPAALAMEEMKKNPYVHIIGSDRPEDHHGILSFTVQDVHPHDVAAILDSDKIAVRAGICATSARIEDSSSSSISSSEALP